MIDTHEKFRLIDKNGKNDFFMSVNWKFDDPLTNECKIIKVEFPDGKESYIERAHLISVLFAISKEEDQQKMIPQKLSRVRWYETVLSVKAQKNIAKGENITFPIKLTLPVEQREMVGAIGKTKSQFKL